MGAYGHGISSGAFICFGTCQRNGAEGAHRYRANTTHAYLLKASSIGTDTLCTHISLLWLITAAAWTLDPVFDCAKSERRITRGGKEKGACACGRPGRTATKVKRWMRLLAMYVVVATGM